MLVHIALCGGMLDDGRALGKHVVSVGMVTVVARIDKEPNRLCGDLTDQPDQLRRQIAVQHRLNDESTPTGDDKARCSRNMVFVEYVIRQDRKHTGDKLS